MSSSELALFWSDAPVRYTGAQLRPGWVESAFGPCGGHALAAFTGPCEVDPEFMVDLEDLEAGCAIRGENMLHFIARHAGDGLETVTLRQRLLICILLERLSGHYGVRGLARDGDDLFVGDGKLSISVATVSPGAGHIHAALNITTRGTPVKTAALEDLRIDPRALARDVMDRYRAEFDSVRAACSKVKRYT